MGASPYNGHYGFRPKSNWGEGEFDAPFTEGDIVFVPPGNERIEYPTSEHCIFRMISAFSIAEGPEWYFRVSPMFPTGRGDRWRTDTAWISDRLHIIPGTCDWTAGFVKIHDASEKA